jgi:hypothetical protein
MYNNGKLLISESERNRIKSLYNVQKNGKFVFDFILTENNKYVILMDQVFVEGGGGKSIGSIWEHTYIFTEILKETISKVETLTENVKEEMNHFFESIVWDKESITEWVKDSNLITEEGEEGFWSGAWDKVKEVGSKIASGVKNVAMSVFKKGILPFMRWIRRNAMTNIGIVIDVVVAILSFKTSSIVWAIIVLIDIYEIVTGDYDPQEPERQQMPFFYLISDLLAVVLTAGSALLFRKSIPLLAKQGAKAMNSTILNLLKNLLSKIPGAKNTLKTAMEGLKKAFPSAGNIVSTMGRGIETILVKLEQFIKKLIAPTLTGVAALGMVKGTQSLVGAVDKEGKLGSKVKSFDTTLQKQAVKLTGKQDIGKLTVDRESQDAINNRYNKLFNLQQVN